MRTFRLLLVAGALNVVLAQMMNNSLSSSGSRPTALTPLPSSAESRTSSSGRVSTLSSAASSSEESSSAASSSSEESSSATSSRAEESSSAESSTSSSTSSESGSSESGSSESGSSSASVVSSTSANRMSSSSTSNSSETSSTEAEPTPTSTSTSSSVTLPTSTTPPSTEATPTAIAPTSRMDTVTQTVQTEFMSDGSTFRTTSLKIVTLLVDGSSTLTITASESQTTAPSRGLSKKDKNIIIGCVVGICVPLLIVIACVVFYTCVREDRTNFINSDGKVITAYSTSRLSKWWSTLLGRKIDKYESDTPLGSTPLHDDERIHLKSSSAHHSSPLSMHGLDSRARSSHELMLDEERYYDNDGNELNGKKY
ncbi:FAEL302Wp [Eremothecium gossypii FDAG1]|nr:FAEL302Wp [Eremothecium gossypii FDAG1]